MSHSKHKWTDEQKFRVVLDTLSGQYSQTEISRNYQVHPNQIKDWTDIFKERAPKIFSNPSLSSKDNPYKKIEELEKIIGKQTVELTILKKNLNYCN